MSYSTNNKDRKLRFLIYSFIFLIIFDGMIRKWMFPSLSSGIMMLKIVDAVAITFCGAKYWKNLGIWEVSFAVVGVIVFFTTIFFGHGNILVDLWGCIPYWFCLPVCVIISKTLNAKDILKIGKFLVYISIINSILVILQFSVTPSHFLNLTGGEIDENIANIPIYALYGAFRPAGLFVYTTQNCSFNLLILAFLLYFLFVNSHVVKKGVLFVALVLVICSIFCSVSRTLVIYSTITIAYFFIFNFSKQNMKKLLYCVIVCIPLFAFAINSRYGKLAIKNLNNRFYEASEIQYTGSGTMNGTLQDIYDRNISYNIKAILNPQTLNGEIPPESGFGQGMSTQIGGKILGINRNSGFALAEWDGLRIVCESGPALGLIIIFLRLGYFLRFMKRINRKNKNKLSVILYPSFFIAFFIYNTWGNAFNICFATFIGGLYIATIRNFDESNVHDDKHL